MIFVSAFAGTYNSAAFSVHLIIKLSAMTSSDHSDEAIRHRWWVRISHWIITFSFLALAYTGVVILMCHPRLYWGDVGNDLTPALIELPISRNYKHGGWEGNVSFFKEASSPVTASRTYEIFNENGWGRSLHFLAAWILVVAGVIYVVTGIVTGHFRNRLFPNGREFTWKFLVSDIIRHLRMQFFSSAEYNVVQKWSYLFVIFILLPLIALTGLTMSPAITAAYPFLLKIFLGAQSARTIHFFASIALELFLLVHVMMIIITGFKQQIRAMTIGR
jgi:thiosulfate reductase cytochrome b subunit